MAITKEKYKKTEIGLIPNDWEYHPIGKYIDLFTGFPFESEKFHEGNNKIKLLRGVNVTRGRLRWEADITKHWDNHSNGLEKYLLKEGDIVISMDGSLVGKNYAMVRSSDLPSLLVQRVARIRCKKNVSQEYLFHFISSDYFVKYVDSVKTSSGIPHISSKQINEFNITLPSLPEQKKIAEILSTWNKSIEIAEKLIAKKEEQKKGIMRSLFRGEKRFRSPDGNYYPEWESKKLGDCLDYEQPTNYLVTSTEYSDQYDTPVVTAGKTFILGYTNEQTGIYKKSLPVIIFDDFTTATQFVNFPFKAKSSAMKILRAKGEIDIKFLYEAMQMIKFEIGGHGRHWISVFAEMEIEIPCHAEQKKIASVLSKADDEIKFLKNQLNSFRKKKRGLMQILLTGKKRVKI